MMNIVKRVFQCTSAFMVLGVLMIPTRSLAETSAQKGVEITPFFGKMFSSKLDGVDGNELSVDADPNFGIAFAWQDNQNGQGQVLLNYVRHNFESDVTNQQHSFDVIYAHFNGIAQYRQHNYVTTVSLGLGGAYFKTDESETFSPSVTIALGTRYEFSANLSLITEIRTYASLIDNNDDSFCKNEVCSAQFQDATWVETSLSLGIAYKF
ncbi:MAG: hypothetical protein HRT38_18350 [Alteromonadaceae bacterium]|nr:hypothetical protein [Alteromonadaceae bacterium]